MMRQHSQINTNYILFGLFGCLCLGFFTTLHAITGSINIVSHVSHVLERPPSICNYTLTTQSITSGGKSIKCETEYFKNFTFQVGKKYYLYKCYPFIDDCFYTSDHLQKITDEQSHTIFGGVFSLAIIFGIAGIIGTFYFYNLNRKKYLLPDFPPS